MSQKSGVFNFIKLPNLMVGLVVACVCLWCGDSCAESVYRILTIGDKVHCCMVSIGAKTALNSAGNCSKKYKEGESFTEAKADGTSVKWTCSSGDNWVEGASTTASSSSTAASGCAGVSNGDANVSFNGSSVALSKCVSGKLQNSVVQHCSYMTGATKTNMCTHAKSAAGGVDVCASTAKGNSRGVIVLYQFSNFTASNQVSVYRLRHNHSQLIRSINGPVCYVWLPAAATQTADSSQAATAQKNPYAGLVGQSCQAPAALPAHATSGTIILNPQAPNGIACGITACEKGWHVDTRNYGQCLEGAETTTTASCDAEVFMVASGNQCVCMPNYEWRDPNNHALGCVESAVARLKQECLAAVGTTWNEDTSVCTCNDANYEYDTEAKTCTETELYASCQSLVSAGRAEWDDTTKVCTCTETNYLFSNGQCIEDPAIVAARNAEVARVAKRKIEDAYSKLKRKQDGFKVSVWKNDEGKFNTARLASDSVAGVALGAVGGIVTNKQVTKHQVEDGFEALECIIQGRVVAQWNEEFNTGPKI